MSALLALGGIGRGVMTGARELRDAEDYQFQRQQRERLKREQAAEDEVVSGMRGVPLEEDTPMGPPTEQGVMGLARTPRARSAVLQDQSNVLAKSGALKYQMMAPQFAEMANASGERERSRATLAEAQAEMEHAARDPAGYLAANRSFYAQVPDGMDFAIRSTPQGARMVHFDQNSGQVRGEIPITPQLARAVASAKARASMSGLSVDSFYKALDSALAEETLGLKGKEVQLLGRRVAVEEGDAPVRRGLWAADMRLKDRTDPNIRAQGVHREVPPKIQVDIDAASKSYADAVKGGNPQEIEKARQTFNAQIARGQAAVGRPAQIPDPKARNLLDPQARAQYIATLTAQGMGPGEAALSFDTQFGGAGPDVEAITAALQAANQQRGGGKPATPAPATPAATQKSAAPAQQRGIGDTSIFEKMPDAELKKYVDAGNLVAKQVANERRRQARRDAGDSRIDPGH